MINAVADMAIGRPIRVYDDLPYPKNADENGLWPCVKCWPKCGPKPQTAFGKNKRMPNGLFHICKDCHSDHKRKYHATPRGFVKQLLRRAYHDAAKRKQECTLTFERIFKMWVNQRGLCNTSRHPLELRSFTYWSASLDRLDDKIGYVEGNVVLVAQRFNTPSNHKNAKYNVTGSAKWSCEKFLQVFTLRFLPHDLRVEAAIDKACSGGRHAKRGPYDRTPQPTRKVGEVTEEVTEWQCRDCEQYKPLDGFTIKTRSNPPTPIRVCKPCFNKASREVVSIRTFMRRLLNDARKNNTKKPERRDLHCTITLDYILELLKQQRGRCDYSNIPMVFRACSDWKCSIERINNKIGYEPGNVRLVCAEFNSADSSLNINVKPELVQGTAQWSRQLVAEAWAVPQFAF